MPAFHLFTAGGKKYMFDANANAFLKLSESLYNELIEYKKSNYNFITQDINSLLEHGYLKDRRDFEMIHPMDETLPSALDRSLGTMALQVTQNCNLRCKYCAYSGSYDNRVHSNKRMNKLTAFKAIDFLFKHSIDREMVSLGFYGGEPLLEIDLIKECVNYARKKSKGKRLLLNITTNATLIKDDVLEFLYDNDFGLTISLDGNKEAHDKNRVFAVSNNGSFNVIMTALGKIKERHPDYMNKIHINAVIDPQTDFSCTSSFFSNYETVKEFFVQANLVSENYRKDIIETDEEYRIQYSYEIFKLFLYKLGRLKEKDLSKLVQQNFIKIQEIHERSRYSYTTVKKDHHSGPCVPGVHKLFVDVEGNLFPCERVSESSKAVRIGHINTGFDIERAKALLNIGKLTEKECKQCWAFRFCTSCPVQADDLEKLSRERKLENCHVVKAYLDNMIRDYCVLRELGHVFEENLA